MTKRKPLDEPAKKTRTEEEYQELKRATVALGSCVNLTLRSRGKLGTGSGMVINMTTRKVEHWSVKFFDALEMIGISYDRSKFFDKPKRKGRG